MMSVSSSDLLSIILTAVRHSKKLWILKVKPIITELK